MKSFLLSLLCLFLVAIIPSRLISQTTCPAPTGLTTTNIGTTVATFSWTAATGSFAYVIQYRPITTPESPWINITVTAGATTTVSNLVCGTHYQWHVAAYCGNSTTTPSPYSAMADFTTMQCGITCPAPLGLTTANITATGATLAWVPNPGAIAYVVQYRPITTPESPWINVPATQLLTAALTNLTCGTHYQWHVQAYCGTAAGSISPYSVTVDFTTAACTVTCPAPAGLTTANITQTTATLTWTGAANSFAYIVQYRPITTPESAWTNITVTAGSTIQLSNLTCGTHYQWHVAAYCGSNTSTPSPYSATVDFTTAACTTNCLAPTGLTTGNITATGATLAWVPNPGAIAYAVQYRPITTPESAWINVSSSTPSITLTNLTCGTHYQWHVQAYCGTAVGNISPYSVTVDFTTAPCTTTCPTPAGPVTSNIGTTVATLSWIAVTGAPGYVIQYRPITTPESAWITINTQNPNTIFTLGNLNCGTLYQWHVAALCANGTTVIGPYTTPLSFTTAACATTCLAPTGLTTGNIGTTVATLSWVGAPGSLAYIVQYRPITTPESAWINVTSSTPSITLTNLVCGKHYQWHVQAYCGSSATNLSPYSITIDFTTAACPVTCPAPAGLTTTNITQTGATLTWVGAASSFAYIVQYRPVTTPESAWTNITVTAGSTIVLSNLTCGTHYQWHVASYCGNSTTMPSPYSAIVDFTTAACTATCPPPVGLTTTNITQTAATLSWVSPAGTLAYLVQYRPITTPESAWINVTSSSPSITLTNLVCGKHYQWHVQAYCGTAPGNISPYSVTVDFTTAPCPTNCLAPTNPVTSNIGTTTATVSWTGITGAPGYVIQYRPITTPESAWININTQNPATTFTIGNLYCGTLYQWHVAAVCGNATGTTAISPYSATINFTTAPCPPNCLAPTALTTGNISTTGATVSWIGAGGSLGYLVQYRPITTPESAWINISTTQSTITLTNLLCGKNYQWHVQAYCGSTATNLSPYSVTVNFTTLPCTTNVCPVPTGLSSAVLTSTPGSRLLSWNSTGAMAYYIRYRIINTPTWITSISTTNSKLITGLQPTSNYEWQVQSICSTSNGALVTSDWSLAAHFETQFRAIFPNPASGRNIQVPVETATEARVSIIISDRVGKAVKTINKTIAAGGEYVDIDIANLDSGIYFVQIRGEGRNEVQKLFITR